MEQMQNKQLAKLSPCLNFVLYIYIQKCWLKYYILPKVVILTWHFCFRVTGNDKDWLCKNRKNWPQGTFRSWAAKCKYQFPLVWITCHILSKIYCQGYREWDGIGTWCQNKNSHRFGPYYLVDTGGVKKSWLLITMFQTGTLIQISLNLIPTL